MTSVTLPSSLTSIGDSAFDGCTSLASIEFPSSLSVIGEVAFRNCPFTSVDIPATITNIKRYAFNNCRSLTSVTVRATTPPTLGESAFYGTPANMVIYVPAESVETYKAANNWSTYASQIQAIPSLNGKKLHGLHSFSDEAHIYIIWQTKREGHTVARSRAARAA